jgi:hypothetical protein
MAIAAMFKLGFTYTRSEIHEQIGGSLQSCFLSSGGSVVGICLLKQLNPKAPDVVLVGRGRQKENAAELLHLQGTAVPLFMKTSVNKWHYVGMYSATDCSSSASEIKIHATGSGRHDVAKVLKLKELEW